MRVKAIVVSVVLGSVCLALGAATAQTTTAPPATDAAAASASSTPPTTTTNASLPSKASCEKEVQGLKRIARLKKMQACMKPVFKSCMEKAVAQKVKSRNARAFLKDCVSKS
jgi:hypothetical protein